MKTRINIFLGRHRSISEYSKRIMAAQSDEQLKKAFDRIDKSRDGIITVEELKNYYLPMQEMIGTNKEVALQELRGLLRRLDIDESGTITFDGKTDRVSMRKMFSFLSFRIQTIFLGKISVDPFYFIELK